MASPQRGLAAIGIAFIGLGAYLATAVDPLTGLGVLIVGAFLLFLPFMTIRDE